MLRREGVEQGGRVAQSVARSVARVLCSVLRGVLRGVMCREVCGVLCKDVWRVVEGWRLEAGGVLLFSVWR